MFDREGHEGQNVVLSLFEKLCGLGEPKFQTFDHFSKLRMRGFLVRLGKDR